MSKKSEFGKGLVYNLGLFLAHERLFFTKEESVFQYYIWFNGASDHLYEIQIPAFLPKSLQKRLGKFRTKCISLGHGFPASEATKEDYFWAIDEAKTLLRLIDKCIGVESVKGKNQ